MTPPRRRTITVTLTTRPWYLMTRRGTEWSADLWFESAHGSRASARSKAERLLAEPLFSTLMPVICAAILYRGEPDPRTDAERAEDARMYRPGWER